MDSDTILKSQKKDSILLSNEHYYKYIFKKTENIVCAVFFILNKEDSNQDKTTSRTTYIDSIGERTLTQVSHTLSLDQCTCESELLSLLRTLIEFESTLRLAVARGHLPKHAANILISEIETVGRSLDRYLRKHEESELPRRIGRESVEKRVSESKKDGVSSRGRQETILEFISSKGQVNIKDISSVIKDCSEKTIQRDLNDMIEKSMIKREGKRRWSTYSVL